MLITILLPLSGGWQAAKREYSENKFGGLNILPQQHVLLWGEEDRGQPWGRSLHLGCAHRSVPALTAGGWVAL